MPSRRSEASPHDSIRDLRFHWSRLRPRLVNALRTGIHHFNPVEIFRKDPDSVDYTGQYLREGVEAHSGSLEAQMRF